MKQYQIQHNGEMLFHVHIYIDNKVKVYKPDHETEVLLLNAKKVFIGKSPICEMTRFSLGYGEEFDGNTILLQLESDDYVFIGRVIYSFRASSEIVRYVSPVGNNCVPYPYAVDVENNYYFLIEYGMLTIAHEVEDPYRYYYEAIRKIQTANGIEYIKMGGEEYNVRTDPFPEKDYVDMTERLGSPMYIKWKNEEKEVEIGKREYIERLDTYNRSIGLKALRVLVNYSSDRQ